MTTSFFSLGKLSVMVGIAAMAALLGIGAVLYATGYEVHAQGVNIEEVFWCAEPEADGDMPMAECVEAREAILYNCTACHTFVPVVKAQKTEDEWNATLSTHTGRMDGITERELSLIQQYVIQHFNPNQPVPVLPPELENQGTNQAF